MQPIRPHKRSQAKIADRHIRPVLACFSVVFVIYPEAEARRNTASEAALVLVGNSLLDFEHYRSSELSMINDQMVQLHLNHSCASTDTERYLKREWKRYKPHLPPSDSVPTLHLVPIRPLFTCGRCGFSNTLIPLCLWCTWSSEEATRTFERRTPKYRRLSAPAKVHYYELRRTRGGSRSMSVDSAISSRGPVTPQGDVFTTGLAMVASEALGITAPPCLDQTTDRSVRDSSFSVQEQKRRSSKRPKMLDTRTTGECSANRWNDNGIVAAAARPHISLIFPSTDAGGIDHSERTDIYQQRKSMRVRRRLPALLLAGGPSHSNRTSGCSERASSSGAVDQPLQMSQTVDRAVDAPVRNEQGFSSNPLNDDIPPMTEAIRASVTSSIPSASSMNCSPSRTLRRKKRLTLLKQKSSRSLRKRGSIPFAERMEISAPHSPRPDKVRRSSRVSSNSSMAGDPQVRLGHPSRPYYTAIRKNMSRPNTPGIPGSSLRTPSPIPPEFGYTPRGTKSLDCGERTTPIQNNFSLRPTSMLLPGRGSMSYPYAGFSLSGETELKMALARWRSREDPEDPGEYRFRDMGRGGAKERVKGKVMQIGKGLKDLVLGKH